MELSPSAMGSNMQTDAGAFDAWALLIHVHCGLRVELTWNEEPEVKAYRGHFGRFLYQAMKFSGQYPSWFSLSPAMEGRVAEFRTYLRSHSFCNNIPGKEVGIKEELESRTEAFFAGECASALRTIAERAGLSLAGAPICRQLPVGLFEGEKAEGDGVFPRRAAAIDLWTTSGDSIVIFELKTKNPESNQSPQAGILSELMFYANYMADMFINNENKFRPQDPPKSKALHRGYRQFFPLRFHQVHAALLTNQLHTSGHAGAETLREVCRIVSLRRGIIPIHGETPDAFRALAPEIRLVCLEDGQTMNL